MMNSAKKTCAFLFLVTVSVLLAGCTCMHYEGITEPALPSDAVVELYFDKSQIPTEEYVVMGQVSFETSSTTTRSDIQKKLMKFARKKGANGVLVHSMDRVKTGEAREDQLYNRKTPSWDVEDNSNTVIRNMQNTITTPSIDAADKDKALYGIQVNAELLFVPQNSLNRPE